ncbi:MAG TPA: GTP cyclohydrolase MptA [Thermoplasmata archaeon]|jgi:GTP cyclohydrolase-4|nr:GTP cyclohydrolase MptA [Thermoplasmata archaeon]
MPDVQSRHIDNGFRLTKVGVTGVMKPVQIARPQKVAVLTTTFDVFVDLPWDQRGAHLSRNLEAIGEIVDESVRNPVYSLEDLTALIAGKLLEKHSYATDGEVWARADYFLEKTSPMGRKSLEPYKLVARANAHRGKRVEIRRSVGVEVLGMTACPCAMETIREENPAYASLKGVPIITHNQRNRTALVVEEPDGFDLEADDLIAIVESSMSAPTYEVLKRPDEGRVVEAAHARPRFVEDVVREVLSRVLHHCKGWPDDVRVKVKSDSEESIHKHNAVAERVATLGELRAP